MRLGHRNCIAFFYFFYMIRANFTTELDMQAFTEQDLERYNELLEGHSIYNRIQTLSHLKVFMKHHVYCVWDFMSLLKFLQSEIAPVTVPWMPSDQSDIQRLINEIVVEEETDVMPGGGYTSHFEIYLEAMKEIAADITPVNFFLASLGRDSLEESLKCLPEPSRVFTEKTFSFIQPGKAHLAAVAFCIGRENIIPVMFSSLLEKCGVSESEAPMFHYYLKRHIEIDGDKHGPMALNLLNDLCGQDTDKILEARQAADEAIQARLSFMDLVELEMDASLQFA